MLSKWDNRFLELAQHIAGWSKDPSTKVGAVIADAKHRIVSLGFNGFPAGIDDSLELYTDRDFKLRAVIHAEVNAILFAGKDLIGCTIYVWPMPPCAQCAAKIIQTGITQVVTVGVTPAQWERWGDDIEVASKIFAEAGVTVVCR